MKTPFERIKISFISGFVLTLISAVIETPYLREDCSGPLVSGMCGATHHRGLPFPFITYEFTIFNPSPYFLVSFIIDVLVMTLVSLLFISIFNSMRKKNA